MTTLTQIGVITDLTFREARRRRLLWLGLGLGIAYIALFGTGFYFAFRDFTENAFAASPFAVQQFSATFLSAGLYVVNFLIVVVTVLTSVGSISAELQDNTIHAIAAKPIYRWQIIAGKWLGHALMAAVYTLLLALGPVIVVYVISGYLPANLVAAIAVLVLECLAILSLTMLFSSSMSTLAAGVVVFMMYGLAFVGGWVEQIGTFFESQTAIDIGIASSLLVPSEALWRYAAAVMVPAAASSPVVTPFTVTSQPTPAFVLYAVLYTVALLVITMVVFTQRDF